MISLSCSSLDSTAGRVDFCQVLVVLVVFPRVLVAPVVLADFGSLALGSTRSQAGGDFVLKVVLLDFFLAGALEVGVLASVLWTGELVHPRVRVDLPGTT